MRTLILRGWGRDNPAFRQVFTSLFIPDASTDQMKSFNETQRLSTSPETAARIFDAFGDFEVTDLLPRVKVPTLVLHCRGDAAVSFKEGRRMAAKIAEAEFVSLDSQNHVILEHEPAWQELLARILPFLATGNEPGR
jgi:pimeloyl-ACP methyl ester carboxylesterase